MFPAVKLGLEAAGRESTMPSSTSLLESEEAEPELPPLVAQAFAGMGLDDHAETREPLLHSAPTPHRSLLGTVLDLQPLRCHQAAPEDEGNTDESEPEDADTGALLVQAQLPGLATVMLPGMEVPETAMLYGGVADDSTAQHFPGIIMMPSAFEMEPSSLLRRKGVNTTECVAVPSSEHVAEIVGRQGEFGVSLITLLANSTGLHTSDWQHALAFFFNWSFK